MEGAGEAARRRLRPGAKHPADPREAAPDRRPLLRAHLWQPSQTAGGAAHVRIVSFALWGAAPRYTVGAVRNAHLAPHVYPGWVCRFYCGASVPAATLEVL